MLCKCLGVSSTLLSASLQYLFLRVPCVVYDCTAIIFVGI
uniref:Uncharacterized protein n=1 Tax=Rhizophora mucronata TaxID=61149 RepID=A0A2P2PYZ6_RHIMU